MKKTLMMMILTMMKIFHQFPDPCLLSGAITKPKDKKDKRQVWCSYLIVGLEKTKSLMKLLKLSGDKKNKGKENSILKNKLRLNKKPLLTKFLTKLEESWKWDKKNKMKRKRKKNKKFSKALGKLLRSLWWITIKEL